ncbi:MAG TPA: AI-2E family transporter [Cellvibrionaceae bacterium]
METQENSELRSTEVMYASKLRIIKIVLLLMLTMAVLYTFHFARSLIVPVIVASFIALFASRMVRWLLYFKVPRPAGAAVSIAMLLTLGFYMVNFLSAPAARWLKVLPLIFQRLAEQMNGMSESIIDIKNSVMSNPSGSDSDQSIEDFMGSAMQSLISVLAESTAIFFVQLGAVVVITYFFLVFGQDLMRNLVRSQATFSNKKVTVVIFQAIQSDVSRYILIITLINCTLGLCTAAAMAAMGVKDPLLWGALAAMLNYAPYVGPFLMALILTGVGFVEFDLLYKMLMVPGIYLLLNFIECQLVTPTVLGQRFNINPLLVVLWMFFWGWLWGAIGMLIAIPLLMSCKIFINHLDLAGDWIKILEGHAEVDSALVKSAE